MSAELDHLHTFSTVHRAGSISEGARLLGISQPTASAHIASLERSLGYPLFVRGTRGVTATVRGDALALSVAGHIDALDDAVSRPGSTDVYLGGPAEFTSIMILPALGALHAAVGSTVRVSFGLADDLIEQLRSGALDVVISAVRPQAWGVTSRPLYDEEFVLVAAPSWVTTPLEHIPLVAYADDLPIIRRYWRSVFGTRPTRLAVAAVIPDLRGILTAVISGAGMSVLPVYIVSEALTNGVVVVLNTPDVAPLNTVYLATRSSDLNRRPVVEALVKEIATLVSSR